MMDKRSAEKRKAAEWRAYWAKQAEAHGRQRHAEREAAAWAREGERAEEISLEFQWRRIERIRVARDDSTWAPTGMLSGGGWLSERYGHDHAKRYFRMLGARKQNWRRHGGPRRANTAKLRIKQA
jgi:hypothetical protein